MASSSALNYIPFRSDSFKTLPNSRSFPQLSLPTPSKSQLSPLCLANYSTPTNTLTSTINTTKYTTTTTTSDDYKTQISSPTTVSLSDMWREIQGCNNWENLLDPLHPLLRREIIRYGEFVTACYKAFDLDPNSSRFLNCKYGKKRMLSEVGMPDSGYQVVKYIYASPADVIQNYYNPSPSSCSSRWIGFIAVSDDEATRCLGRRDIVVTFRGTVTSQEWVANLMSSLTPARLDPHDPRPEVKVEQGFLSLYTSEETSKFGVGSCREQVLSEIWRLLRKHKGEKMSLTMGGHSMGSALGVLVAYDVAELGLNRLGGREDEESVIPVAVFSFGGPRVGNLGFKKRCEELGVRVLRITNVNDPITKLPGVLFNNDNNNNNKIRVSNLGFSCYAHVGVELLLDFFSVQNPSCVHDLGSYINCLLNHSNNKINHSNSNEGFGIGFRNDQKILTDLVGKGREWMLSSHNTINVLPGVFAAAGNHHAVLGWVSGDLINSWGNQLLFGLVLLFM